MRTVLLMIVMITMAFSFASATVMGDLAASMQAGEWAELATQNLTPVIRETNGGATGCIFPYSEDGTWDPNTEQFFFMGGDHIYDGQSSGPRFISYSAATNTWQIEPKPSWMGNGTAHGYDHSALDPATGTFYHYPVCCGAPIRCYSTATKTWTQQPSLGSYQVLGALELFPATGGLVFALHDKLSLYNAGTRQWSTVASGLTMGDYHNFAEYNPVHRLVIFGGGNGSPKMYRVDSTKTVTPLSDAPFQLRVNWSIVTVDPVSGDYLVFGDEGGSGIFYVYDVVSDQWTSKGRNVPFFSPTTANGGAVFLTVAAPVSTYGVVMFVKSNGKVYLYKHSGAARKEANTKAEEKGKLTVSPNPFKSFTNLRTPENASIRIFNLDGKIVADLSGQRHRAGGVQWSAGQCPAGIYFIRAEACGRTYTQRIVRIK